MAEHLMVRTQDVVGKGLWRLWPVINCDKTKDIPRDYPGAIGVPITYMDKHDPERFELLGMISNPKIKGRNLFKRLVIRNLHPELPEVLDLTEWFERMGETLIVEEVRGERDMSDIAVMLSAPNCGKTDTFPKDMSKCVWTGRPDCGKEMRW